MESTVTIIGVSEEVTTCDCCGKSNLKRTVALRLPAGGIVHYGCDCAAKTYNRGSIRNFNGQDVRKLGQHANLIARHGEEAVARRFGYGSSVLTLEAR